MSVASKNLYDLLGNTEEDGSENPAPVRTVTKTSTKTGKANADGTGPIGSAAASGPRSGNKGGFTPHERAYREGAVGNKGKPTDDAPRSGARGGRGARGRGGRGATHHRNADDRHTKNIVPGSEKQAAQSWGATEGVAELNDEQAGEAIAQSEQKDAEAEDAEAEAQEPEVKTYSYDDWQAQLAEKRAALNAGTSIREANAGSKDDKWTNATAFVRDETDFIPGSGGKRANKPLREKNQESKPQRLITDDTWKEPERTFESGRGARGGRGGRGGERSDRRGGAPRGAPRGGAPRGGDGFPRGGPRGGPRSPATINTADDKLFPKLGSN